MYLDVKVDEALGGELAGERLVLAAGEVPSEPGGVGARPIPFARGSVRTKCWSVLWRLSAIAPGEMAR
jgi:hypothetical protein